MIQRYESYKPSGIPWAGEIPSHWGVKKNKFLLNECKAVVGKDAPKFKLLSLTLQGVILRDMENPKGKFPAEFDTYKQVSPGDLIFCLFDVEETPRTVGLAKHHGMITGAYTVIRCNDQVCSGFLYYYYLSLDDGKKLRSLYTGLRNVITRDAFFSLVTPLPPREEQDRIVAFLDQKTAEIDAAIAKKERMIELLEVQKKSLIYEATTLGIHSERKATQQTNIQWIKEIPEHWNIVRLKTLASFITSGPRGWSDRLSDHGPIFVQSGNLNNSLGLNLESAHRVTVPKGAEARRTCLQNGDVVICITGANTGRVAVADIGEQEAYVNQHLSLVRIRRGNPRFVAYSLSAQGSAYFYLCQYGLKEGLSLFNVSNAPVALPPLTEQDELVEFLDDMVLRLDSALKLAQSQIETLHDFKRTLIAATVTGKLKP